MAGKRLHSDADWEKLAKKAREHFGVSRLRPGQRELIETVMGGGSAMGILPTGAGKSLCYQLPALFLPKATLVVSPLLSLMRDQTLKMEEAGVETTKFDSTLTVREERQAVKEVKNRQAELIYVTPERLVNPEYLEVLRKGGVSLLVVDEAHCVSQWGHDFRPAFLQIREAAKALGSPPILALTATATPQVENDVLEQLGIPDAPVYCAGVDRTNLEFEVYRTVNDDAKFKKMMEIVEGTKGNGIVYVATVKLADELHRKLLGAGVVAGKYHGKMNSKDREYSQTDFMDNRYKVMVATKAFGLGIDKPDVRFVLHYTFPDSVESYYQEAGRAGRDGKKARAVLLYRIEDKRIHQFFLGGKYPTRAEAVHLYTTLIKLSIDPKHVITLAEVIEATDVGKTKTTVLLSYLEKAGIVKRGKAIKLARTFKDVEEFEKFLQHYDERHDADKERIDTMMKYGQTTGCRAQFLREYFGEAKEKPCKKCDNCRGTFVAPKDKAPKIPFKPPTPAPVVKRLSF